MLNFLQGSHQPSDSVPVPIPEKMWQMHPTTASFARQQCQTLGNDCNLGMNPDFSRSQAQLSEEQVSLSSHCKPSSLLSIGAHRTLNIRLYSEYPELQYYDLELFVTIPN